MSLAVLDPGPLSLVVDLGRPHHRSVGVPLGGAADRAAFLQGNALVGNPSTCAALEFTTVGPTLRANCDLGCVIFGAPFDAWVDGTAINCDSTFNLKIGSTLRIGNTKHGLRGYLCVADGIHTRLALESRTAWDVVQRHDVLPCGESRVAIRSLRHPIQSFTNSDQMAVLRCIAGPQSDWFGGATIDGTEHIVSPQCNRMGVRLHGVPLPSPQREMVSEPVCPGSVQVVNDGQCIVLGVDCQTIGGYPKIAQVIAADLGCIGQLRIGQPVRFQLVSIDAAEELFHQRANQLRQLLTRLQLAAP